MKLDDLRLALRQWGIATANRYCMTRSDRTEHMLGKARDMAPGTKENALRALVGRDGTDRRRLMAAAIPWDKPGKRMELVPMWAADPIRTSNDADHPHERSEIAVDQGIPDNLVWVEKAIAQLWRQHPMRALILQTEYTVSASQHRKAAMVEEKYDGKLSKWMYRRELQLAENWISALRGQRAA